MDCEETEKYIPDYLAGDDDPRLRKKLEEHINSCPDCQKEISSLNELWAAIGKIPEEKPSPALRHNFEEMLKKETSAVKDSAAGYSFWHRFIDKFIDIWPKRPAIQFAMVIAVFAVGMFVGSSSRIPEQEHQAEMAHIENKLQKLNKLVILTLLEQSSPSDRLKAINLACTLEKPNEEIIDALIDVLNDDPNQNIRLATINILQDYSNKKSIKMKLLSSLMNQSSPLIQLGLIEIVIRTGDKSVVPVFREMLANNNLDDAVKKRLEYGILTLTVNSI